MKKPQNAKKRQAAQKRATKRTERRKKTEANKHIRNKEKKNLMASQQRKFNDYMKALLANPEMQQPPQE